MKPRLRPKLLQTPGEEFGIRSGPYFLPIRTIERAGGITDQALILDTLEKEAENSAVIARYDYENDLQIVNANKLLFEKEERLFAKRVVSEQEYFEFRATLEKSVARSEAAKAKWAEFEAEVTLGKIRVSQTQGAVVPITTIAKAFAGIWEARLNRAKSAEVEAKADYLNIDSINQRNLALVKKGAVTEAELIQSTRDSEQSRIVLKLSSELVEQVGRFYAEAQEHVKVAEQFDAAATEAIPGTKM